MQDYDLASFSVPGLGTILGKIMMAIYAKPCFHNRYYRTLHVHVVQ